MYRKSQVVFMPEKERRPSPLLVDLLAKGRVGVRPREAVGDGMMQQQQQQQQQGAIPGQVAETVVAAAA